MTLLGHTYEKKNLHNKRFLVSIKKYINIQPKKKEKKGFYQFTKIEKELKRKKNDFYVYVGLSIDVRLVKLFHLHNNITTFPQCNSLLFFIVLNVLFYNKFLSVKK